MRVCFLFLFSKNGDDPLRGSSSNDEKKNRSLFDKESYTKLIEGERANQDVKKVLGIFFLCFFFEQFIVNIFFNIFCSCLKVQPIWSNVGTPVKIGWASLGLQNKKVQNVRTEEELQWLLGTRYDEEKRAGDRQDNAIMKKLVHVMLDIRKKFPPAKLGDTVKLSIPDIDKGRGESRGEG